MMHDHTTTAPRLSLVSIRERLGHNPETVGPIEAAYLLGVIDTNQGQPAPPPPLVSIRPCPTCHGSGIGPTGTSCDICSGTGYRSTTRDLWPTCFHPDVLRNGGVCPRCGETVKPHNLDGTEREVTP